MIKGILICSSAAPQLFLANHSQNHRMVGVGRNLCGSSSPTLLPKQGHLQQAAQHHVQPGLNISREGDSTTSLGSLFQGSDTLRGKKFFLMFRRNIYMLGRSFLPPLYLARGVHRQTLNQGQALPTQFADTFEKKR